MVLDIAPLRCTTVEAVADRLCVSLCMFCMYLSRVKKLTQNYGCIFNLWVCRQLPQTMQ